MKLISIVAQGTPAAPPASGPAQKDQPAIVQFIPIILLVMLLPITVNGLGVSQWAFLWTFTRVGVSDAHALALSILFVALGVVGNLPGGLLYAFGGRSRDAVP